MYEALGVKDIDLILKKPPQPMPKDPALEHIDALAGMPFRAYPGQDHRAHITAHLNFIATNMVRNNPMVMGAIEKNCLEHISLMAQEQIELEFRDELPQLMQMQQQAQQNPQMQQQAMQLQQKIEARKAVFIAEMTEEFMKEEKQITSQFDHDPLLKLKSREVDLRAMDQQRKKEYDEARVNIDQAKLVQAKDISDEKLEQNEELAELRADTTMDKAYLSAGVKLKSDAIKRKDVKTLKGPKR